jgi:hypothetical protein
LQHRFLWRADEVQHLYEGEPGDDVFPGGAAGFEIDEGPEDRADLEALIEAGNGTGDSPWSTRIASRGSRKSAPAEAAPNTPPASR